MLLTLCIITLLVTPVVFQLTRKQEVAKNDAITPLEYVTEDPRMLDEISYIHPYLDFILLMVIFLSIEFLLDSDRRENLDPPTQIFKTLYEKYSAQPVNSNPQ
jgi:hypothetical protein